MVQKNLFWSPTVENEGGKGELHIPGSVFPGGSFSHFPRSNDCNGMGRGAVVTCANTSALKTQKQHQPWLGIDEPRF